MNDSDLISPSVLKYLNDEIISLDHGKVNLEIIIRERQIQRYLVKREQSFLSPNYSIKKGVYSK